MIAWNVIQSGDAAASRIGRGETEVERGTEMSKWLVEMTTLSAEQEKLLAEISERCARSTPGPWVVWRGHSDVFCGNNGENTPGCITGNCVARCEAEDIPDLFKKNGEVDEDEEKYERQAKRNAAFIASARTDIPALLAIVDQLRTVPAHEWISVETDLPKDGSRVNVCLCGLVVTEGHYNHGKKLWRKGADFHGTLEGVTHWQPLPSAPPAREKEQA